MHHYGRLYLHSLIRATAGPGIREGEYGKAVGRGVLRGRAPGIIRVVGPERSGGALKIYDRFSCKSARGAESGPKTVQNFALLGW